MPSVVNLENLAVMSRNSIGMKRPPQPSHFAPKMMLDKELVHATTSTRKESHSPPTTLHALVKGVSRLNLCTNTGSSSPVLEPCSFYYYEVGNDDGSHTTETATSSTLSSLSPQSQSPSPMRQGRSVRLTSPSEATSFLLPVARPQPITSGRRHSTTSSEFSIAGVANGKPGDRRQSVDNYCYSQSSNSKTPKNPETLERWSELEWLQNKKKHRRGETERQLELKRLWELQQQQQQQQQHFYSEERIVARRSQGPCDIDDVSVSSDEDQQRSPARSKGPCDVDEIMSTFSDSSEDSIDSVIGAYNGTSMDGDKVFNHQIEGYKDDIRYLRKENTDSYEDPPLEAQTSYARQQLLRSSRYRAMREQTKAQRKKDAAFYYQVDSDFLDEVEMSRGLGGYEEGFGVPTINSSDGCHHLPLSIEEAEEEDEVSVSSFEGGLKAGNNDSTRNTELETITAGDTNDSNNDRTRNLQSSWTCVHSRSGTCENRNSSNSGFMV
jgi:hypothetical protein